MRWRRVIVRTLISLSCLLSVISAAICVRTQFTGDEFATATWDGASGTYIVYDIWFEASRVRFDHTHDIHGPGGRQPNGSINLGWYHNLWPTNRRSFTNLSNNHWWGQFNHRTYTMGQSWRIIFYLPLITAITAIAPIIWLIYRLRRRTSPRGFPVVTVETPDSENGRR